MSSRKPKNKNKKKKKKDVFASKKTLDAEGFDFVALVAGMVTTSLFVLLLVGQMMAKNAASRAIEIAEEGDTARVIAGLDQMVFEQVLQSSESDKLVKILSALNEYPRSQDPEKDFAVEQRKIDIANALLVLPLDAAETKLVVISKIDSLVDAYLLDLRHGLEKPNLAGNLKNCATEYSNDAKLDISRSARLALFKLEAYGLTKNKNQTSTMAVVKQVEQLLKKFPNDEIVQSQILKIVEFYLTEHDKETGVDFVKRIQFGREKFASPGALNFIDKLADYIVLEQSDYQELFDNRLDGGTRGRKQLFETSLSLMEDPKIGRSLIAKIDEVAHWFEQIGEHASAKEIYSQLAKKTVAYKIAGVAPFAHQVSECGLKRAKLVGCPLAIEGVLLDGSAMDPDDVKDKIVLVFFWSSSSEESVRELTKLHTSTSAWSSSEVAVLGVCIDEKPGELTEVASQMPRFKMLINDPASKRNQILDQCPSLITPRAMLVGRDGRVVNVNVPLEGLKISTQVLLADGN